VRIAVKKLRYAVEPLLGILAPKIDAARLSKRLNRLQTALGHLNDLKTITPLFDRLRSHVEADDHRQFELAEYFCHGWSRAAAAAFLRDADLAMRRLEKLRLA
jgi:CHAD domain-containing protein